MIKKIGKVLVVLLSVTISVVLTIIICGLIVNYVNNNDFFVLTDYQNKILLYKVLIISLFILVPVAIFTINFIWVWKISKIFPKLVIAIVLFIILGMNFLFKPFKISGGNVGPYKEGQTVLAHLIKPGSIKLHDVVVFKRIDSTVQDWIGYVVGLSGDNIVNAYYFPNNLSKVTTIPAGLSAVKFGKGEHTWLVANNLITHVVWYAFR